MKRHTPYAASCLIFILVLFGMPALADHTFTGSTRAGPGETVTISTGRRADYMELTLANRGSGAAQAVIDSSNYDDSIMIEAGGKATLTKIFGPGQMTITNESASSTIKITHCSPTTSPAAVRAKRTEITGVTRPGIRSVSR